MNITINDCIGQLKGIPPKVVDLMIANQVKQGNPANVKVFQDKVDASFVEGGFSWNKSAEGQFFWSKVINGKQFPAEVVQPDKFNEGTTGTSTSTLVGQKSPEEVVDKKPAYKVGDTIKVKIGGNARARVVIGYFPDMPNPYLTITKESFNDLMNGRTNCHINVAAIKGPEEYVYLTLKDISEGKGVGVDPSLIRIRQ